MIEAWIVAGSMKPSSQNKEGFTSGIDGYEVYIKVGEKKYKLTNKELEQFKIENND